MPESGTDQRATDEIARKVHAGERLGEADGVALMASADIHTVGELADLTRRRLHGPRTYYNVNRHIHYTNICVLRCRFCGFCRARGDADAYELSVEQMAAIARQAAAAGATEVHITGGLHPNWTLEHYERMLEAIRQAAPAVHIKAFTAVEIVHVSRLSHLPTRDVLRRLIDRGLGSLPGGGAEIFDPRVHEQAFPHKIGPDEWFAVHRQAHELGLKTNATMLYGHIESPGQRVEHMLRLRELQDATGGFQCFVPLSFQPAGAWRDMPGPTGLDDLRTVAVARLLLDNIPHIKTFWVMHGTKLSQIALDFGADDIDGTVVWYDITQPDRPAQSGQRTTHQELTVEDLRRLIVQSGHVPVQRDSLYRAVGE